MKSFFSFLHIVMDNTIVSKSTINKTMKDYYQKDKEKKKEYYEKNKEQNINYSEVKDANV